MNKQTIQSSDDSVNHIKHAYSFLSLTIYNILCVLTRSHSLQWHHFVVRSSANGIFFTWWLRTLPIIKAISQKTTYQWGRITTMLFRRWCMYNFRFLEKNGHRQGSNHRICTGLSGKVVTTLYNSCLYHYDFALLVVIILFHLCYIV